MAVELVRNELSDFADTLQNYVRLSSKTSEQALSKKGRDFSLGLSKNYRGIKPEKGSIRSQRLSELRRGIGVTISPNVRRKVLAGKGVNVSGGKVTFGKRQSRTKRVSRAGEKFDLNIQQLLIDRELSRRESAIGFVAFATRLSFKGRDIKVGQRFSHTGRGGQEVGAADMKKSGENLELKLRFGGRNTSVAEAIQDPKLFPIFQRTLKEQMEDMQTYIRNKHHQAIRKGLKKI